MSASNGQTQRYHDLRVVLSVADGESTAKITFPHEEEARNVSFLVPYTARDVARCLKTVREGIGREQPRGINFGFDSPDPLRDMGTRLFIALFGHHLEAYRDALRNAAMNDCILRIRIVTADPGLSLLPWELLYDVSKSDFAALGPFTTVTRQWDDTQDERVLPPIAPPLRVLVVALGSSDKIAEEQKILYSDVLIRDLLSIEQITAQNTPEQIANIAKKHSEANYHIIHFMADPLDPYISRELSVSITTRGGSSLSLGQEEISSANSSLRLVYYSGVNTLWLSELGRIWKKARPSFVSLGEIGGAGRLPVATHELMSRQAQLIFTRELYGQICNRKPLDAAVSAGRYAIDRNNPGSREWGIPVVYLQALDEPMLAQYAEEPTDDYPDVDYSLPLGPSVNEEVGDLRLRILKRNLEAVSTSEESPIRLDTQKRELEMQIREIEERGKT